MRVEFPQAQDQENIKVPYFELSKFKGSTPKLKQANWFLFWLFPRGNRPTPPKVFLVFHHGNRLKIGKMHEALNAMIFAWLLWRFVYILLHPYWMYDSRISQFDLRHVNQRRQINDSVFRLFDSFKWLITLRSIISPCQKATTIILIPLYNPSFDFWNHQKHLWALPYFCLGCLLKSATVTSFSQLLSRNSGPRRSREQINPHSKSLYTRWLIKEAKKVWTTFESVVRNGKFHV